MPACTGLPSGAPCPRKSRGADCKLGFGDDFFCESCMTAQRNFRLGGNTISKESNELNDLVARRQSSDLSNVKQVKNGSNTDEFVDSNIQGLGAVSREKVLIQPVLGYILFSMQSASAENVKLAAMGHFIDSDICDAKDMLWYFCGTKYIGEKKVRKDSNTRSEKEDHLADIINALIKLDKANKVPTIVLGALSLGHIPRSHPEELNNISLCDRLNQIECRMKKMQEQLDCHTAENMMLHERLEKTDSYASVLKKDNIHYKDTGPKVKIQKTDILTQISNKGVIEIEGEHQSSEVLHENMSATIQPAQQPLDNEYQIPLYHRKQARRKKMRKNVITGSRAQCSGNVRGAPDPDRHLFIYRVDRSTVVKDLESYISERGVTVRDLQCVSNCESKFKSFKLTVSVAQYSQLFDSSLWPQGVRIRPFYTKREDRVKTVERDSLKSS